MGFDYPAFAFVCGGFQSGSNNFAGVFSERTAVEFRRRILGSGYYRSHHRGAVDRPICNGKIIPSA